MSTLRKLKKKIINNDKVQYICPSCKFKEFIPLDVVQHFDLVDSYGVDNSYPPRFECLNCGDDMMPIYYKSVYGIIHKYKDI